MFNEKLKYLVFTCKLLRHSDLTPSVNTKTRKNKKKLYIEISYADIYARLYNVLFMYIVI